MALKRSGHRQPGHGGAPGRIRPGERLLVMASVLGVVVPLLEAGAVALVDRFDLSEEGPENPAVHLGAVPFLVAAAAAGVVANILHARRMAKSATAPGRHSKGQPDSTAARQEQEGNRVLPLERPTHPAWTTRPPIATAQLPPAPAVVAPLVLVVRPQARFWGCVAGAPFWAAMGIASRFGPYQQDQDLPITMTVENTCCRIAALGLRMGLTADDVRLSAALLPQGYVGLPLNSGGDPGSQGRPCDPLVDCRRT